MSALRFHQLLGLCPECGGTSRKKGRLIPRSALVGVPSPSCISSITYAVAAHSSVCVQKGSRF